VNANVHADISVKMHIIIRKDVYFREDANDREVPCRNVVSSCFSRM